MKKTRPAAGVVTTLTDAVALPASTGAGVTAEVDVADAVTLGNHQNDDLAGDLAAAHVTRPVVAVGAVVEPVNPALATEKEVTGDAAGDAAIVAAGAGPEFVQPIPASMETLGSDTFAQSGFLTGSTEAVPIGVQDIDAALTETNCENFRHLVDMAKVGLSLMETIDLVATDGVMKGWTPAEDPAEIVLDLVAMLEDRKATVGETSLAHQKLEVALATGRTHLRVTSSIEGFRRGGIAHSKTPVEYRLDTLTAHQVEAILAEPNLVAEII